MSVAERRTLERELTGLRDRLVINHSPLVKYIAGQGLGPHDASRGPGGRLLLGHHRAPGRYRDLRPRTPDQVRVVRDLEDTLGYPRRAEEGRLFDTSRAPRGQRSRAGHKRTGAEARACADGEGGGPKVGLGISEHRAFLERCSRVQVGSLEARLECEGYLHGLVADSRAVDAQSAAETAELRARLVEATQALGEQERVVTTFYFYERLTLREIGGSHNLAEGRISQILH